jgi:protein TonB
MNRQPDTAAYLEALIHRNWLTWLGAGLGAITLNLALFAVMPYLLHPVKSKPVFDQVVSQVNVIRIKRPETPVKRKTEAPPEPPPPPERRSPEPTARQPIATKMTLPFSINPKLPSTPNALSLPVQPMEMPDRMDVQGIFSVGDLDSPLTVLTRIPPIYPLKAKHRGIEGWVRIRFIVNEEGGVEDTSVVESNPPGVFDRSVIRCVSGWRFRPGTVEGVAVRTRAETVIRFSLE